VSVIDGVGDEEAESVLELAKERAGEIGQLESR